MTRSFTPSLPRGWRKAWAACAVLALLAFVALPRPAAQDEAAQARKARAALEKKAKNGDVAARYAVATADLAAWKAAGASGAAPPRALYALSQAAEAGHLEAQRELGQMLKEGVGVARDPKLARVWLRAARKPTVAAEAQEREHGDASKRRTPAIR